MIGVVAEMLKVHPQTLRFYEKKGLVRPGRTEGQTRMYSEEDLEEIARLLRLTRDLGVNLAGVEIVLKMRRRMIDMQQQIEEQRAPAGPPTIEVVHVVQQPLIAVPRRLGPRATRGPGPGSVQPAQVRRSVLRK